MMTSDSCYSELPEMKEFVHCWGLADRSTHGLRAYFEEHTVSDNQYAIIGLASNAYSVFFSLRQLFIDGYLVSAAVLLRSFVDRIATIAWLSKDLPDRLEIYLKHWDNSRKKPSITERLREMENYVGDRTELFHLKFNITEHVIDNWLNILHSYTHGDQKQADLHSTQEIDSIMFRAGPDLDNPTMCSSLSNLATIMFGQFMHELQRSIPFMKGINK